MDGFRTGVSVKKSDRQIDYTTPVVMAGSCFADGIGRIMQRYKFPVCLNPFGIVFHPLSMAVQFSRMLNGRLYEHHDLQYREGLYFSFDHHGSFSHPDADICLAGINDALLEGRNWIEKADFLFLTFGTAWSFRHLETNQIVANCHKEASITFERRLNSIDEIVSSWKPLIERLAEINPKLRMCISVSPVRHLRDGAHGNQVSKATLMLAAEELCKNCGCMYFPSYEIVNDELRDYRFYADDMLHISEAAVNYIWQRFVYVFMTDEATRTMSEVVKVTNAADHRLLHHTEKTRDFARNILAKIAELEGKTSLRFDEEKAVFQSYLDNA